MQLNQDNVGYTNVLHSASLTKVEAYLAQLKAGTQLAGAYLQQALNSKSIGDLSTTEFIACLLNSKKPQIFAESSVYGDGSDWNQIELGILGDISMAMEVEVYDNGLHHHPTVHLFPFNALLIYTPGALLRSGTGNEPVDWAEVTKDSKVSYDGFYGLYERRLLPCLLYANEFAQFNNVETIITIPGLGCGQFAGKFKGQLGSMLKQVLVDLITKYVGQLTSVRAIYYDPFDECENARVEIEHLSLMVRPLLKDNNAKGQLCAPSDYEDSKGEFSDCTLTSFVAWDHVSWPGNDFYIGSRATDDGVKAAATNTMAIMTSYEGQYSQSSNCYQPPNDYATWGEVVARNAIPIMCKGNLRIY